MSGARGITRRQTLTLLTLPLVVGCEGSGKACIDSELLGAGERQMRATLAYIEAGNNPAQQCDNCQFFHYDDGACGKCEILNGPVSVNGYCSSWAQAKSV